MAHPLPLPPPPSSPPPTAANSFHSSSPLPPPHPLTNTTRPPFVLPENAPALHALKAFLGISNEPSTFLCFQIPPWPNSNPLFPMTTSIHNSTINFDDLLIAALLQACFGGSAHRFGVQRITSFCFRFCVPSITIMQAILRLPSSQAENFTLVFDHFAAAPGMQHLVHVRPMLPSDTVSDVKAFRGSAAPTCSPHADAATTLLLTASGPAAPTSNLNLVAAPSLPLSVRGGTDEKKEEAPQLEAGEIRSDTADDAPVPAGLTGGSMNKLLVHAKE